MLAVLGTLLVIWLVFIVIGALFHTLFWLLVIGVVLFLATSGYAAVTRGRRSVRR